MIDNCDAQKHQSTRWTAIRRGWFRLLVCVSATVMVASACGHSSQQNSTSSTAATTTDTKQARENSQATQLCARAFAASAGAAQQHARPPVDRYDIGDNSQVKESIDPMFREWTETGISGVDLSLVSNDPDQINTLLCVRDTYTAVGYYRNVTAGASDAAVREDFDARVVDWHSGDVLASQQFQGADPPESAQVGSHDFAVVGDAPEAALGSWLNNVIAR